MSQLLRRLLLVLLLAVVVYGVFVIYTGYHTIARSLDAFRPLAFVAALALATLNYLIRFLKWEFYLARLNVVDVRKLDSLLVFLSGFVLTVTPGKVGEVFKSVVLAQTHGVPISRTAPIVIAERLTDVIAIIVLILIGSVGLSGGLLWAGLGTLAVCFGLLCIFWQTPVRLLLGALSKTRLGHSVDKLETAYASLRTIATPQALVLPTLLSIVGWGCEGVALHVLLLGFDAPASLPLSVFFYSTATLAGALIPLPGGLGVTDGLIQEQLVRLGSVPLGVATASMLMVRVATLWWAVLVGFVALGLLRRRHRVLVDEPARLRSSPPETPNAS